MLVIYNISVDLELRIYMYIFSEYRLVIICSSEAEDQSLFVSKLSQYRRPYLAPKDVARFQEYLLVHFEREHPINGLRL